MIYEAEIPVRIAWSTRNWLLSISIILISAGILHPTTQFTKHKIKVNSFKFLLNMCWYKPICIYRNVPDLPLTSTISPGTSSDAGSMEKQPATESFYMRTEWTKIIISLLKLTGFKQFHKGMWNTTSMDDGTGTCNNKVFKVKYANNIHKPIKLCPSNWQEAFPV